MPNLLLDSLHKFFYFSIINLSQTCTQMRKPFQLMHHSAAFPINNMYFYFSGRKRQTQGKTESQQKFAFPRTCRTDNQTIRTVSFLMKIKEHLLVKNYEVLDVGTNDGATSVDYPVYGEAAARLVGADGFIKRLPEGYQTMLSDNGSNLSQGQRQLLSIARCAVADPPVMILDEATSSIDTHTEEIVQRGMDALMTGRTTFVIAHRLSTVRNSDAIIVLDHGRIIERGSHDELIAKKGTYYQLYTGAFELE